MQQLKKTSLVWFTNNLRVLDNIALTKATEENDVVFGIYCFNPEHFTQDKYGFKKTEKFRAQFLIESVNNLQQNLLKYNISLAVVIGKPSDEIPKLVNDYNVENLYFQKEWTQEEVDEVNTLRNSISDNVEINEYYDQFLYHPEDIYNFFTSIPNIFTNFRKKAEKYVDVRSENSIKSLSEENLVKVKSKIPTLKDLGFDDFTQETKSAFPFKGGESEALKRLDHYFFRTKKLSFYKKTRNGLIGRNYSSKFSPWLANGAISAKTIYWKVKEYEDTVVKNQSTYWLVFELIWRDFFKYISIKHNNSIFKIEGILNKKYPWSKNQAKIESWINGETASDFVNANMIELKKTGWMSNRGRQNVASYFARELELDWRIGAAYFESMLLDYDVHSNYGNWMYVAGVGNDPRDRKFNVQLQAERYDTDGKFRKLWLQETLF